MILKQMKTENIIAMHICTAHYVCDKRKESVCFLNIQFHIFLISYYYFIYIFSLVNGMYRLYTQGHFPFIFYLGFL